MIKQGRVLASGVCGRSPHTPCASCGRESIAQGAQFPDGPSSLGIPFVLPALVFFAVFNIYPMINAFYVSLTKYNLLRPPVYIGFDSSTRCGRR